MLRILWLIPVLPLLAAGLTALLRQKQRSLSAALAIGSMVLAGLLSCGAFIATLDRAQGIRQTFNFAWFDLGSGAVQLGWVLDPLAAIMLVMVTLVGTLIFIYSVGYMAHDENFTRFFCFLSLFAAAMLGLVIANSLLLFFICWELVGLASYLLIGFWFHKPSAAAAAKKAFITTRIGDLGFLLGIVWLYAQTGTLLFYNQGFPTTIIFRRRVSARPPCSWISPRRRTGRRVASTPIAAPQRIPTARGTGAGSSIPTSNRA